jgi:hypothetical protein
VHDAVAVISRGKAAVVAVTAEFESLARIMAADAGHAALRIHALPCPLESRPEEEVRSIAREHYRSLLRTLGVRD